MKIHYAEVDWGYEDGYDEWGEPICNTKSEEPELSNRWSDVSCKHCLKQQRDYQIMKDIENELIADDMGRQVEFYKNNPINPKPEVRDE